MTKSPASGLSAATKAPASGLSVKAVEKPHPHYEYDSGTGNPRYTEDALPVALQNKFKTETMESSISQYKAEP